MEVEVEVEQDSDDEWSDEEGECRDVAPPPRQPPLAHPHDECSGDLDPASEQAGGAPRKRKAAPRPEASADPPLGEEGVAIVGASNKRSSRRVTPVKIEREDPD